MFDSVLSKSRGPQGNIAGLALSIVVYALLALVAVFLLSRGKAELIKEVDVKLFTAPPPAPPPPPPPPPPAGAESRAVEKKPVQKKRETVIEPKIETEEPKPTESTTTETSVLGGVPGGVEGGVPGGVVGGVIGGVVGGVVGGVLGGTGNAALPFGPGMTRPERIAGSPPEYTAEAMAARVEGKVLVRCVITTTGEVQDCKVIKGVPFLSEIVVESMQHSRFTPVTFQGRPETVQYIFPFNFKLP